MLSEYINTKSFNHLPKLQEDQVQQITEDGRRVYVCPGGKFPSVTTVVGWEKNEFFKKWRRDNPKESQRVCQRGTNLHKLIENYLLNEQIEKNSLMPDQYELFKQVQDKLDTIDNVHALEYPLWGAKVGLAGRVDCVADYNGVKSIIDFKGSTNRKREEDIENYKLQATAYALLWEERFNEKIENIVILITCEDSSVQEFIDKPIKYVGKLFDVIQKYKEKFNEHK